MSAGRCKERADCIRGDFFLDRNSAIDIERLVDVEVFDINFALLSVAFDHYSVGTRRAGAKGGSGIGGIY